MNKIDLPFVSALPSAGTRTLVYAHRGAMAYAPQNTMPSFELAWEMGAHGIELDVQCSRDGVPVIFHDDTIDALTDGHGAIHDHNLEALLRLDAGSHFSSRFSGERIPLFETVLRSRPTGSYINIELKTELACDPLWRQLLRPVTGYPALRTGMSAERETSAHRVAHATADCIRSVAASLPDSGKDLVSHLIISSFDPVALADFAAAYPGIPVAFLYYSGIHFDTRVMMKEIEHQAWHPYLRETNAASVRTAHDQGMLVNCWTVNSVDGASRLIGMKVDGLITNYPDVMLRVVNTQDNRAV